MSDEMEGFLRIWPHSLKKSFMENLIFFAVQLSLRSVVSEHKMQSIKYSAFLTSI